MAWSKDHILHNLTVPCSKLLYNTGWGSTHAGLAHQRLTWTLSWVDGRGRKLDWRRGMASILTRRHPFQLLLLFSWTAMVSIAGCYSSCWHSFRRRTPFQSMMPFPEPVVISQRWLSFRCWLLFSKLSVISRVEFRLKRWTPISRDRYRDSATNAKISILSVTISVDYRFQC